MDSKDKTFKEDDTPMENGEHLDLDEDINIEEPKESGSVGAIIGAIVIVLVIALGGLWFWGSALDQKSMPNDNMMEEETKGPSAQETLTEPDPIAEELSQQSQSDAADSIEQDLLNTDIENLDADLEEIEAEIEAELNTF